MVLKIVFFCELSYLYGCCLVAGWNIYSDKFSPVHSSHLCFSQSLAVIMTFSSCMQLGNVIDNVIKFSKVIASITHILFFVKI